MKFWPARRKTSRKTTKKAKARTPRRWPWLLGVLALVAVTGLGLLSWSRTDAGRSTLLKLGAEGLHADVRADLERSLAEVLPAFAPGPADSTAGIEAPRYDWPAADEPIRCRVIEAPADLDFWRLQDAVRAAVEPHGGEVLWGERLRRPRRRGAGGPADELLRLDLAVAGRPTHTLVLHPAGTEAPLLSWAQEAAVPSAAEVLGGLGAPTVAIIVDDWGHNDTSITRAMLNLDTPLTLSVLPGLRYSRRYALAATDLAVPAGGRGDDGVEAEDLRWERGSPVAVVLGGAPMRRPPRKRREVMLHLPMEPQGYPQTNPGENALLTGMSREEIAALVDGALAGLPGVTGVNNHMGSAATADRATMDRLMGVLDERGLLFVDSKTTNASVADDAARAAGVPVLSNRSFLDQSTTSRTQVRNLLADVVRVARATGSATAICHPYPETVDVLMQELPRYRREGVRFVTVSEMLALRAERAAGEGGS